MPSTPTARRKARKFLVQALYQWQLTATPAHEIDAQFRVDNDFSKIDGEYFTEVLASVTMSAAQLDSEMAPYLDREVSELDPVSKALLRVGMYEMKKRVDVPYKVVINEAVNLAKTFGATDSFKYVNGVLDKAAKTYRAAETNAG
ncbi:MAG: transcription antitermination factor NusB [Gammaproteobacteria bacterium]|jgi:N utilization substance protein B|nr:transcription antitermination factor NusB [Gammaproteobacteria bacterium]